MIGSQSMGMARDAKSPNVKSMTKTGFSLKFIHKILLAASALVIATFVLFTLYIQHEQSTSMKANLDGQLKALGSTTATSIANWLGGRVLMVETLAQTFAGDNSQPVVDRTVAQDSFKNNFMFTYLGTAEGKFTMSPPDKLPDGYDPRTRPWYKDAVAAKASTLTEPYADASTGKLIVTVATPVNKGDQNLGVVGGDLDITTLVNMVQALDLNGMGYGFLVNGDGTVIVHPDKKLTLKPMTEAFPGANLKPDAAGIVEANVNGEDRIFIFLPVQGLPTVHWYLGLSIDKSVAFASLTELQHTAIITTIIAVVLVLLLLGLVVQALVSRPLVGMTNAMNRLAAGDHRVEVPGSARKDEIGAMSAAVLVFKENAIEMERLAAEQERTKSQAAEEQRAALHRMADLFETSVGQIVGSVSTAATDMQGAARSLLSTAEETNKRAVAVSAAAAETTNSVQSVAAATEELAASISEIGRQVTHSTQIAGNAVDGVSRTNTTVKGLADAAQRIGEVVNLIQGIAQQTNLLALNATIEAARAGDAGKGFAVVASEVKALANQTDGATGEIGSQINAIQSVSGEAVSAMDGIAGTIQKINEIASAIAAAVEEQGAATQEIAGSVQQAANGTNEVSRNVAAVTKASGEVGDAAGTLLQSASSLTTLSDQLRNEVHGFLARVRAA